MGAVSAKAKAKLKENQQRYANSPKGKYTSQKSHAKTRGIAFHLSFAEWLTLWEDSGKYPEMGKAPNQYCMTRDEDQGPYEVGNVRIQLVSTNLKEQLENGAHQAVKLNSGKYAEIKQLLANGRTQKEVAAMFGLSQPHVSRLASGLRGKYFT